MINYYIGTLNVPYFTINQTTGTSIVQSSVLGIFSLDVNLFPITFQVDAQDLGSPPQISKVNATMTIYFNNGDTALPARWLNPIYEELNFPTHLGEILRTLRQSAGFNGTILSQLSSQTSFILTVNRPFVNTYIPFSDLPMSRNGHIFSSAIVVTSGLHAEIPNLSLLYIRVLVNPPLIGSTTISLIDEDDRRVDPRNNFVQYLLNTELSDAEASGTISTNATFDRESNTTSYRILVRADDIFPTWNSAAGQPNTQDSLNSRSK